MALKYVPENLKTPELCLEVVKQNGAAIECVPENLKTSQIFLEMENYNREKLEDEEW